LTQAELAKRLEVDPGSLTKNRSKYSSPEKGYGNQESIDDRVNYTVEPPRETDEGRISALKIEINSETHKLLCLPESDKRGVILLKVFNKKY
jgi:hypothetical protein